MLRRLTPLLLAAVLIACTSDNDRRSSSAGTVSPVETAAAQVASATAAPITRAETVAPTTAPPARASAEPSGEEALAHARALAQDIGSRPPGTNGERRSIEYIAEQLRSFGYEVELQPFLVKTFVSRSVSFRVLGPPEENIRTSPLTGSPKGSVTAELFHVGLGLPEDYPSGGIGGKIALIQRGQIEFGEKVRNAAAAGASAIAVYDPPNDVFPGRLSGQLPGIPALTIPGKDGVRLRDLIASGPVRVSLSFDGGLEELTANNIIGRPQGGTCVTVVGSHYDSVETAPGASDNASGTATMLEMARVQALRGNTEQACFIAFGAEELGLLGSIHYVQQLSQAERQAIKFMINMDMTAVGDEWLFIGTAALQRRGQEIAESMGISGRRADLVGASSDHASFIERRIPALMLHRSNDNLLHTPQDTVDRITAPPLETAVRLGLAWLAGLSQS